MATIEAALARADGDQVRMMEERVIVTDYFDNAIGNGSKKETHIMTNIEGGMLHRAFSVFLFTPDGKLVLQQRAACKITFPLIWANTCCSHPLDVAGEREEAEAAGVKNAARRKLEHELGIPPEDVPLESFTWITRVHYMGACKALGGIWGEHEIDWILLCRPKKMPRMALNPNEVAAVRAFAPDELRRWLDARPQHGNEVSPWFGVMAKGLLFRWWDAVLAGDLRPVLDRETIHRQHDLEAAAAGRAQAVPMPHAFAECLASTTRAVAERYGVADEAEAVANSVTAQTRAAHIPGAAVGGSAGSAAAGGGAAARAGAGAGGAAAGGAKAAGGGGGAAVAKQGAYGQVKIHRISWLEQLSQGGEVLAALRFKLGLTDVTSVRPLPPDAYPAHKFCEAMLAKTSRSFSMVIQQLPAHLRLSVCIFYLVLRGLDTLEDDMEAFRGRAAEKCAHLRAFHRYLRRPDFRMTGVGEGDERFLLEHFYNVNSTFTALPAVDQDVIADICARMGDGMAAYAERDLREGTETIADYNRYAYIVAGLVGEGLTRLFVAHGDEAPEVAADMRLAIDMGLFLQKTNIIRDYLEDLVEGRAFWPREVWGLYASSLGTLRAKVDTARAATAAAGGGAAGAAATPEDVRAQEDAARECLNHMVADALALGPSCLAYLRGLRHPEIFRFCAIPQMMAMATLEKLVNNADVFTGVVKIRKGTALRLLLDAGSIDAVYLCFLRGARSIAAAIPPHHAAAAAIAGAAAAHIEAVCLESLPPSALTAASPLSSPWAVGAVGAAFVALLRHMYARSRAAGWGDGGVAYLPRITDSADVAALTALVACVLYLFAFAGVPFTAATVAAPPSPPDAGGAGGGAKKRAAGSGGDSGGSASEDGDGVAKRASPPPPPSAAAKRRAARASPGRQ